MTTHYPKRKSTYPSWAPRFWHGMLLGDWIRLLRRNHFRVHPSRWGLSTTITMATVFNSVVVRYCRLRHRRKVESTALVGPPVFIIGHWRSGTTYLHELLSADPRFATPTSYQCFAANHFLSTQAWLPKLLWFLMPSQRPMDNVRTAWDSPQEDEFALCSLGCPSPYLRMAFPNEPSQYLEYLDLENLPDEQTTAWQYHLRQFLQALTCAYQKRLVLKSPTHTARIARLAQMFPGAKFLHITRDPLSIFPSTVKLWEVLDEAQGLQRPHYHQLRAYIFAAFDRMYRAFDQQRGQIPNAQLHEIRYEDLVANPVDVLAEAYAALELGDFEVLRPKLELITKEKGRYRTNRYELADDLRDEILHRWSKYAKRYGYGDPDVS